MAMRCGSDRAANRCCAAQGELGLGERADEVIWQYAKEGGYGIVTQDADYAERSRLHGSPPKVVWLRCGHTTPPAVEQLLRQSQPGIVELRRDSGLHYIELL